LRIPLAKELPLRVVIRRRRPPAVAIRPSVVIPLRLDSQSDSGHVSCAPHDESTRRPDSGDAATSHDLATYRYPSARGNSRSRFSRRCFPAWPRLTRDEGPVRKGYARGHRARRTALHFDRHLEREVDKITCLDRATSRSADGRKTSHEPARDYGESVPD